MAKTGISEIADTLWKEPSEANWKRFAKALPKSGIVYYRAVYQNGGKLNRAQDLTKSYVELYDSKEKLVAKVPIFKRDGGKITGATYYMKGLLTVNRPEEWVK
jgi:hypothetical protein